MVLFEHERVYHFPAKRPNMRSVFITRIISRWNDLQHYNKEQDSLENSLEYLLPSRNPVSYAAS